MLAASAPGMPPGDHPFAIYQWELSGLKEDAMLVPVVADEEMARAFTDVLAIARDVSDLPQPSPSMLEALDGWHHDLWVSRRAKHIAEAAEIARFRRDSLEASYRARMAILEEQRDRASEGRIRRMRSAQIERAFADHREALARLAQDEARADILPRRVAAGIIRVEG
jgi:ATP-dependent helicase HepA